ncbi:MAG: SUMF1/EgtB/PvdO family nonheme iron enzyme [Deltaproteobacteria bacterium]|nr:SUMF1/EgtB/PvdO family nonheme iron enzyme [Deltaproteobacteria bacterium]
MVVIPAGTFQMGDIHGDGEELERPVHDVTIKEPFAIGRYEVTFEEYDKFAKATGRQLLEDEGWGRGRRPVINVYWEDARDYANWLSKQTGKRYRLPSEAEWEYAARSGGKDEKWAGTSLEKELTDYAWFNPNSKGQTRPVGTRKPNGLGLYDMSGNVREWVEDCRHKDYKNAPTDGRAWGRENGGQCQFRGLRGGSWRFGMTRFLRTSERVFAERHRLLLSWVFPPWRSREDGFRLAGDIS